LKTAYTNAPLYCRFTGNVRGLPHFTIETVVVIRFINIIVPITCCAGYDVIIRFIWGGIVMKVKVLKELLSQCEENLEVSLYVTVEEYLSCEEDVSYATVRISQVLQVNSCMVMKGIVVISNNPQLT